MSPTALPSYTTNHAVFDTNGAFSSCLRSTEMRRSKTVLSAELLLCFPLDLHSFDL